MILYFLIFPIITLLIGIFYINKYIKDINEKISNISKFNQNLSKLWNGFCKKNKIDEGLYHYLISNSTIISKIVNVVTPKIYKFEKYGNSYNGINLLVSGIPFIRQSIADNSIMKETLQEMVLDIDNILVAKKGELVNKRDEFLKNKSNILYLMNIGYGKIYDDIVNIISIDYLKMKSKIVKKLTIYIFSIAFIWQIIKIIL